jgi:catechol 2,3-dioxygenase-like lactoylglutathione lyase family enzyme
MTGGGDEVTEGQSDPSEERLLSSVQSLLIGVRDLDRSSAFYQDVMHLREVLREDRIAVLVDDAKGPVMLFLRQLYRLRDAVRPGPEALGIRSITFRVDSLVELDRIEQRLRADKAFRDRYTVDEDKVFEVVRGWDPDRLPLNIMVKHTGEKISLDAFRSTVARMYTQDM